MRSIRARALVAVGLAATLIGFGATSASAVSLQPTGQDCVYEGYISYVGTDGVGVEVLGHRCAKARITYTNSSSYHTISKYEIYYDTTTALSYGVKNNENYFKYTSGYRSGVQSWASPDSGDVNVWITRSPGTSTGYLGQTVLKIEAALDVPSITDPKVHVYTATW